MKFINSLFSAAIMFGFAHADFSKFDQRDLEILADDRDLQAQFVCGLINDRSERITCECSQSLGIISVDCDFDEAACITTPVGNYCVKPTYDMSLVFSLRDFSFSGDTTLCAIEQNVTDAPLGISFDVPDFCLSLGAFMSFTRGTGLSFGIDNCAASVGAFTCESCIVCGEEGNGVALDCEGLGLTPCIPVPLPFNPFGDVIPILAELQQTEIDEMKAEYSS